MLTPFRVDTNSLFLTSRLNDLGIDVVSKSVVSDRPAALEAALRLALDRVDIVVTSGGLGPTDDDLTREAIMAAAEVTADEDPAVVEAIARRFASRGLSMPDINRRQAQVPHGAIVLDNPNGTAPGLWLPVGERVIVALPGPPRELKPMWDTHVAPRVAALAGPGRLRRRVLKTVGKGESQVDEVAAPIYGRWVALDPPITTSILASPGQVELHLSAQGIDEVVLDRVLDAAIGELREALGTPVFSVDGRELEEVVGALLDARGATVAVAESCTGGLILGRLTSVSGSSAWVTGGVVAYANVVKVQQLGVPQELLDAHGAVSEPVALAMAAGVRAALDTTYGLAVTGIAGPTGGTDEKPVGTVVIAAAGPGGEAVVITFRFPGDRAMVRQMSVQSGLDMLRRLLAR